LKVTCESCLTVYDLPEEKEGEIGCPICAHVNAKLRTGPDETPVEMDTPSEFDPVKTMIGPIGGVWETDTSRVKQAVAGKKTALPSHTVLSLTILEGDQKGQKIPLTKSEVVIGRKQGDIILNDPEVSRRHCGLLIYGDLIVIRDLGSANGILVNDRIAKEELLKNGDTFQVGGTVFKLSIHPKK
jgi:pSer/pThr/pTyr-binding forkhead associated (FHA) protein